MEPQLKEINFLKLQIYYVYISWRRPEEMKNNGRDYIDFIYVHKILQN